MRFLLRDLVSRCFFFLFRNIHGAFNKSPDFFVQAFKIGVDSWKFTMSSLYIVWDDWPSFMISNSNEQLQKDLEYPLLKTDCHSWWISKMQSGREDAIKLCFKLEKKMPCNESWIYSNDSETKRQSSQWNHAGSPRPKKARQSRSTHKLLMIPFLTVNAWSPCTGFPLDRQSTRNTMFRF